MNTQHTPGPWMIFDDGDIGSASVRTPDTTVVRSGTVKGQTIGEAMSNARLIAAAPELLAALRAISAMDAITTVGSDSQVRDYLYAAVNAARAAIAKAEGK